MKQSIVALSMGFIFGIGLLLSGMTQPQKVIGFLDFFGNWDPSLLFVMVGAIAVHSLSYLWIKKRPSPLLATKFQLPKKSQIDWRLVAGASVFGFGWGLAGYCPGPAVASVASLQSDVIIFLIFTVLGMVSHYGIELLPAKRRNS